ncbi:MAG: winged helix-turn-helix domain-containing protein [Colwellia sp.]|nr:winged helix-turn-helix domain-containing protein [Colwellia sp.]
MLDVQRGILTRNKKEIALPKLSYELLLALLKASPTLLTQSELMEVVWPNVVIGDETLKQRVKLLRKVLGDNASEPIYIEAVRGRGYRLVPEVSCECILARPAAVMLDLTGNDQFPNLDSQQFIGIWQTVSKTVFVMLFVISLLVVIYGYFFQKHMVSALTQAITEQKLSHGVVEKNDQESNSEQIAEELYQKGLLYYRRYRAVDNLIAIDFYKKALVAKADYSLAYAGLSQAYSQQLFQFESNEQTQKKAIDNAYQAIVFDSQSAESYKALGTAYYVAGWLSKSIAPYLKSLAIDPDNTATVSNLSFIYSEQGRLIEALELNERALTLDSQHVVSMVHAGQTLHRLGQFTLAKNWYQKAIALQPDYLLATYHLGMLLIEEGQYNNAEILFKEALKLYRENPLLTEGLADVYFAFKEKDRALEYYQKLQNKAQEQDVKDTSSANLMRLLLTLPESNNELINVATIFKNKLQTGTDKALFSYNLAMIYAQVEQPQLAIRYLVQSIEQGLTPVAKIEKQAMFEPLHQLSSYKKLLTNMKMNMSRNMSRNISSNKNKIKDNSMQSLSFWQASKNN